MQLSNVVLPRGILIIGMLLALQSEYMVSELLEDTPICERVERQWATRYVSYQETYKKRKWFVRRTYTRINYRIQNFIDTKTVRECCSGYQPGLRKDPLSCWPICLSGCPNGKCSRPNVCLCVPGYRTAFLDGKSTCVPDCHGNADDPDGCANHGKCIAPKKCKCDEGYIETPKNIIIGGQPEQIITCAPKCVPPCGVNGVCHEPNKCRCDAGYHPPSSNLRGTVVGCLPMCENECINGVCESPNKCRCLSGYKEHSAKNYLCEAICDNDCINAKCTQPNHCECHHGYEKTPKDPPELCSPICDPSCMNATCTYPGKCECLTGYDKDPQGPTYSCLPVCDPPCINAVCIEPDKCGCHIGYTINPTDPINVCSPVCDPPCENGTCSLPNHCECMNGYAKNSKSPPHLCSPVCDPPCINADCTQPNHCECHDRYEVSLEGSAEICLPICDPICVNATCIEPDICQCMDGYARKSDEPQVCSPICNPPCINSDCTRPNHCDCHGGYKINSVGLGHECLPICNPSCVNGICHQPNLCKCHNGFKHNSNDLSHLCLPACDPPCELNASCKSPNQCVCNAGYTESTPSNEPPSTNHTLMNYLISTLGNTVICQPFCEPQCNENASCVAPNRCQCKHGYRPTFAPNEESSSTHCLPICEKDCVNGFCGYPNKCICHLGYKPSSVDDFVCNPHCEQDCINANCTGPNYCECLDGYEKPEFMAMESYEHRIHTENLCIPTCPEECAIDGCIGPNQCLCRPGYVLTYSATDSLRHSCQPVCEPNCSGGFKCITPNHCESQAKYNEDNDSPTTSLVISDIPENCPNDGNFLIQNGKCICKDGWTSPSCDVLSFCIISFVVDNETNGYSIVLSDNIQRNRINDTDYEETNGQMFGWRAPKCNERCRMSVLFSNASKNASDKIMYCHRRILPNANNDSVNPDDQPLTSEAENRTIVCFIRAEFECSSLETQVFSRYETDYRILGAVGIGLLVTTATLVSLVVCILCHRRKNLKITPAVSKSNSIITEWPDDRNHTYNTIVQSSSL